MSLPAGSTTTTPSAAGGIVVQTDAQIRDARMFSDLERARDTLRRIDHAVLLVKNGSEWVMLDMQSNRVAPASSDYGYKPVMSFAGNDSYLHGKRYDPSARRKPRRLASLD